MVAAAGSQVLVSPASPGMPGPGCSPGWDGESCQCGAVIHLSPEAGVQCLSGLTKQFILIKRVFVTGPSLWCHIGVLLLRFLHGSIPTPAPWCSVEWAQLQQSFVLEENWKKRFNKAVASCVTFSYKIVSIFNSEPACISIVSLFITLCFVFCIVTLVFHINFT